MATVSAAADVDFRVPRPLISRRFIWTVLAAGSLTGMCALYVMATRPLLAPSERKAGLIAKPSLGMPLVTEQERIVTEYLPDAPWAADPNYVFRNLRSVMYTNSWEPVREPSADGAGDFRSVKFTPFAIVLHPSDDHPEDPPITIVGESAVLRFQGSIDFSIRKPGRIIGGTVQGQVCLRGPDGLELIGRDFNFAEDALRLWSDEDVTFKQGGNSGTGHGLQVDLFRVGLPDTFDTVAVSGIRSVQLRRDVVLDVQTEGQADSLFGTAPAGDRTALVAVNSGNPAERNPEPLHVTSRGPLTFDLLSNVATFITQVRVERVTPEGKGDTLDCNQLKLFLEPGTEEAKAKSAEMRTKAKTGKLTPEDGFQTIDENLVLKRLVAEGQLATIQSPANDFVAQAAVITHDAATDVTTLLRPGDTVNVRQGSTYLHSPQIRLEPSDDGSPPTVICDGGDGWIQHLDDKGQPALLAQWHKSLRRSRDPQTGQDLIQLAGEASVQQPQDEFTLVGETIKLWLDEQEKGPRQKPAASNGMMPAFASSRMEPVRLVATEHVKLASPELRADTARLDIAFVGVGEPSPLWNNPPAAPVQPFIPAGPKPPATLQPGDKAAIRLSRSKLMLVSGQIPAEGQGPAEGRDRAEGRAGGAIIPAAGQMPAGQRIVSQRIAGPPPAPPAEPAELRFESDPQPVIANPAAVVPQRSADPDTQTPDPVAPGAVTSEPVTPGAVTPGAGAPDAGVATAPAKRQPLKLIANEINVVVERQPESPTIDTAPEKNSFQGRRGNSRVREVHTAGNVRVQQERPGDAGPLLIRGDRLDLYNRGEGEEFVEIDGSPALGNKPAEAAQIHDQGARLYGQVVRVDRRENKAWVDGEGLIRLPVKNTPDGKPLDKPQMLDVWWTERMVFDGLNAVFYGDVRTILNDDRMYCDEMEVQFKERFDFASAGGSRLSMPGTKPKDSADKSDSGSNRADVSHIYCRHGVEVMGHEYEGEKLLSVRQAQFWQFHLDRTTGETTAEGPGWIEVHRRGNGNRAGLAAENSVRSNAPIRHETDQWEYLRVDFGGRSRGNINRRTNTFSDDVMVIYGPVSGTNQKLVADRLPADAGWMTSQALTVTQHPATEEGAKAQMELFAEGNVRLEGRNFYALSDTVSYDEGKGSYLLKSYGNRQATIWREVKTAAGKSKAEGRALEFFPAKNILKGDQITGFDGVR